METTSDVSTSVFFTLCAFNSLLSPSLLHSLSFPITIFIIPFELKKRGKMKKKRHGKEKKDCALWNTLSLFC